MLIWKRVIPKNFRSLVAIGTLSAMVALAPVMQYSTTLGQEPRPPKEQTKEQTKEQKPSPVKGSEEKGPVKKSDEAGPVKGTKEKEPIKKSEEQQQKEGRGEKTEKAPQKKDDKAPVKGNEKAPIRGEEKGTDAAASVKESTLEGQLVKIAGNMLMMTSKGGKEHSLRLMEDAKLTLEEKVFRAADLKPGMIIRVTTLPPDHSRASRIEVLDLNGGPAANTRLPKEGTPTKEMPKGGEEVLPEGVKAGTLLYDSQSSTTCGPGKICFNYRLPTKVSPLGNQTGIGVISLAIYQNGMQVMTPGTPGMPLILTSGKLTSGSSYCFQITLAILSDLNPSLGGFDFVGTGQYSMAGTIVNNATVGMAPDGRIPDRNNDHKIVCGPTEDQVGGTLEYDAKTSTDCGPGRICFNYTLPKRVSPLGIQTGTGVIKLVIYQNGAMVNQFNSPTLTTTPGSYCFPITPAILNALTSSLGGFDFVANGTYSFGTTVNNTVTLGAISNGGQIPDRNNDYQISCKPPGEPVVDRCCLGKNLVKNGDFESPQPGPDSQYNPAGNHIESLRPGTFKVYPVESLEKACKNWELPQPCRETKDFYGNVLLVNGLTNQIAPARPSAVIWQQQIPVSDTKEKYRVCFRYLPLPQCCFDVVAKPTIVVTSGLLTLGLTDPKDEETGCGRLVSATYEAGGTAVNVSIVLPQQNVMGDGNDLMIDNISVAKLGTVPGALLAFIPAPDAANHQFTLTVPAGLTHPPYNWDWEMWVNGTAGTGTGGTLVQSVQGNQLTYTFTGLAVNTLYTFKLKAWSDCNSLTGSYQDWSHGPLPPPNFRAMTKPMEYPNPEAVAKRQGPKERAKE